MVHNDLKWSREVRSSYKQGCQELGFNTWHLRLSCFTGLKDHNSIQQNKESLVK